MERFDTYANARAFVSSLASRGIVPGLDAICALCARLSDPQDKLRIVHIAGTNGKGSAGAFICSALRAAGERVGRYATPAVVEYREIITVDGRYISEDEYTDLMSDIREAVAAVEKRGIYPTSFEAETALAFLYFVRKGCTCAVVECGMGGALDATNVIARPAASVIMPVSIDHAAYLGDTIAAIAGNKAGIIKSGVPVFSARQCHDAETVLKSRCEDGQLCIAAEPVIKDMDMHGTVFDYRDTKDIYIPLAGSYQPQNAAVAFDVCVGMGIDEETIKRGFRDTKWPLRFEADNDGWIFDGAHNPDAALRLRETIDDLLKGKRLIFITGVFRDKAYEEILAITVPAADMVITVKPPTDRGLPAQELAMEAKKYCSCVIAAQSLSEAVSLCMNEEHDNVLVFGSLSFLAEIKKEKSRLYEQMSKDN